VSSRRAPSKSPLAQTSFFCVEERFICADCEHKRIAFNDTHTKKHTLVRVVRKVEESRVSTEERLKAVEEQLGSVKGQLGSLEGQLGSVQEELSKIRQLFLKLFEKGTEGFPGDPLTKGDVLDAAMAEPSLGGPLLTKGEGDGGRKDQGLGSGDEEKDGHEGADEEHE